MTFREIRPELFRAASFLDLSFLNLDLNLDLNRNLNLNLNLFMKIYFDHEKLDVYQKALAFAAWSEAVIERVPKSVAVHNQLDRARTSIVLNIPEGNGRFTALDRCKFFDNARGSGLECAGCLDLVHIKKLLSDEELDHGKTLLKDIVSLLVGLIRSNSPERFHEDAVEYRVGQEGAGTD